MKKRKYIPFNLLKIELKIIRQKHKNLEGNEKKKRNCEMKQAKKWTARVVAEIYSAVLPTASPTEIKK